MPDFLWHAGVPESGQSGLSVKEAAQAYEGSNPSPSTMTKSTVISEKTLQQNPLFWPGQGPVVVKSNQPNIFIGTGVTTPTQLSRAIPLDALGFLLSAEFIKRLIPTTHVFLLIADQHAWLANHFNKHQAQKIAQLQFKIFSKIIASLQLKNWHIFLASKLFHQALPASYEALEIRDVNHFIKHHQVGIKIGWKFGNGQNHKTDEAHFDQGIDIISIFTKPGVTSDPHKPQESPYICTDPSNRILLHVHSRGVHDTPAVQKQLKRITILFEQLIKSFPNKTLLEQKLNLIIKQIFK